MAPYLAPVEQPKGIVLRLVYHFTRRQFGKVATPIAVFSARMPRGFLSFYGKISRLDRTLTLPPGLPALIRERVATVNGCAYCMDAARWYATRQSLQGAARFDALGQYRTSPLFTDAERAALDYAGALATDRSVDAATFGRLAAHFDERAVCDIVWLVASEHLYNVTNIGLDIGSDGLCELQSRRAPARETAPAT